MSNTEEYLPLTKKEWLEFKDTNNLKTYVTEKLDQKKLEKFHTFLTLHDAASSNALHAAAVVGLLDLVNPEILTEENLNINTKIGENNAIVLAAVNGNLYQISEYLTTKLLLPPNKKDKLPLHMVAWRGELNHLPKKLLTIKNLATVEQSSNWNCFTSSFYAQTEKQLIQSLPHIAWTDIINEYAKVTTIQITELEKFKGKHKKAHTEYYKNLIENKLKNKTK
jgi:hypothetical protein